MKSDLASRIANWCRDQPLGLCVLFGSRAAGLERPGSDVDLALWPRAQPDAARRLAWHRDLGGLLELPVQLVLVSPRLDPVLGLQIARQGQVLYEAEAETWLTERVRLWWLYQDSLPFIRAARQQLREFAEGSRRGA